MPVCINKRDCVRSINKNKNFVFSFTSAVRNVEDASQILDSGVTTDAGTMTETLIHTICVGILRNKIIFGSLFKAQSQSSKNLHGVSETDPLIPTPEGLLLSSESLIQWVFALLSFKQKHAAYHIAAAKCFIIRVRCKPLLHIHFTHLLSSTVWTK